MRDSIELLLKYRKKMGISSKNPYVFGLPNSNPKRHRFLRATVLIRKFSNYCGAKKPSTLRGTSLRKHIATKCADMEMNETEISRVANFMGHHVDIHKNIYRQPVAKVDILSMSRVLEKAQKHESDSDNEPIKGFDQQDDSILNLLKYTPDTETSSVDDSTPNLSKNTCSTETNSTDNLNFSDDMRFSARNENDSSLASSSIDQSVLKRKSVRLRSKIERQKSKKINEVDTSTDYQDSSLELSHSKKRRRLNDVEECSQKKVKRRWTKEEIQSAGRYFDDYIENGNLPSLSKIREIQKDYNVLQSRTPVVVKTWLHNQIRNATKRKNTSPSVEKVRTKKSLSKEHWKKHINYIFTHHLSKRRVPSISECRDVIKGNKTFFALCIICCCWVIKDLVYDILRDAEWENYSDDDFEEWIGDDEWDDMCDWDWDPYIRDDDGDFYDWGLVWLFEPEPVPVYENWDEMSDWDAYLRGDDEADWGL
ncbi:uncharacterized protein LOC114944787, partial [Nylanderia fulva]|uniref:uncharacterized protein LOC114944787 n=1 Tax=Nylanderia fulva TaxID=613905 RepID=UPI0010FB4F13